MKNIKNKLKSENGASLLLALLFFCMCAVIGAVVLSAAFVAAGRMTGIKKGNQQYYSLTSATQLFKEELTMGQIQFHVDRSGKTVMSQLGIYNDADALTDERNNMAFEIYKNAGDEDDDYSLTNTYYVSVNDDPGISDVQVDMTMYKDYSLELVFKFRDVNEETASSFVKLTYTTETDEFIANNYNSLTVTWVEPHMSIGGDLSK